MGNPFEKKTNKAGEDAQHDAIAKRLDDTVLSKKPKQDETEFIQNKQLEEKQKEIKKLDAEDIFKKVTAGEGRPKINLGLFGKKPKKEKQDASKGFIPPNVVELKPRVDIAKICMFVSVFGIVALVMLFQSPYGSSAIVLIFLLLILVPCFLSMGVVIGWLFLNIDMRCKILRRMRGRNYGIVHFVLRGSQHLITRIMDFDGDVVVNEMRMWVIDDKGVHYIDRNGAKQFWGEITSDHIKTLPANIPCLYLDYETMVPLKFYKEQSKSDPLQVGSTHLGYIANQIAKNMAFKKAMTLFYIIVVVLLAICLVCGVQSLMWMDEMRKEVNNINDKINIMAAPYLNMSVNGSGGVPIYEEPQIPEGP
jgi:hypothetical protein